MDTMVKATVAAVISPSGKDLRTVLLTRRSIDPFKGHWCFPGGHIDRGETAETAIFPSHSITARSSTAMSGAPVHPDTRKDSRRFAAGEPEKAVFFLSLGP